ncbi:PREDICTED: ell-associated factor Eaf [Ceratosolen solmsi marchali]|uniref:Ell-associated factor Eaf n=1 Tax=Ceratosolen solmsi marchali TaxID=326594 RepID=A0AAJ6YBX5_9HYME|nr:PREDICTED: ell-associated factor Eaf [Ceratosolen solmsi marchali]
MKSISGTHEANLNGVACDMAEKLGLRPGVRELKLGPTFTSDKSTAFHTLKYDFKPASVDVSKMATVDVGTNNTMTVTVPHLDGAGIPHTVFKGSQRPYHKECVLIIDRNTGEITLERLSSNIQVKKTRSETKSQPFLSIPNSNPGIRPITPIETRRSPTDGRTKSRTKVTSGKKREPSHQLRPKHSPPRASYHGKSPPTTNLPTSTSSSAMPSLMQSTLASLPMISEHDDFNLSSPPAHSTVSTSTSHSTAPPRTISPAVIEKSFVKTPILDNDVGILSDSSTSGSSSDSSDSESEPEKTIQLPKINGHATNGTTMSPSLSMPDNLLNEDLQLSESESDSD